MKTTELLGLSADEVEVEGRPLGEVMNDFTTELKSIRTALQCRDYVLLTDMLLYETSDSTRRWNSVLGTLRNLAA